MGLIKIILGVFSAIIYGYLKYNVDGYYFIIPFILLVWCLM